MAPPEDQIGALTLKLDQYSESRYPVQRATTLFHLGTALLQVDQSKEALQPLAEATRLFKSSGMALEQAKAANMHGVALRTAGQTEAAVEAFLAALQQFHLGGHAVEEAATSYNLGLAYRDENALDRSRQAFTHAAQLFVAAGRFPEASAAAREQASILLKRGEIQEATDLLTPAVEMALRAGDMAGGGAAANMLGLTHLAAGQNEAACTAFHDALGAHPRSVRPAENAMVRANLALALERCGDTARARLSAEHTLANPAADLPVRIQVKELLKRLPPATGSELFDVLEDTSKPEWVSVIREELHRWAGSSTRTRNSCVAVWVQGQLQRRDMADQLAAGLLGGLLELPPTSFQLLVESIVAVVASLDDVGAPRIRATVRSAMTRFAPPQWQRLAAAFNAEASRTHQPEEWS